MDELGKSIPAAEAMVDAEQSGKGRPRNEFCLNCGTRLVDIYCHHCGQKDIPRRQTLGELWINFISSFWSYEGKFFQSTSQLILKPGFLAMEYNAGRRESYFHPARMYVFISFLFFLLFFSLPEEKRDPGSGFNITRNVDLNEEEKKALKQAKVDSIIDAVSSGDSTLRKVLPGIADTVRSKLSKKKKKRTVGFSLDQTEYKSKSSYDSAQKVKPESERDGWLKRRLMERTIELNQRYKGNLEQFGQDFKKAFRDNFSKILFYLLPVFAILLKLLYIRRDYYYSEHLVFSIYYYNFFYLAAIAQLLVDLVPYLGWLATLIGFWIYFYLLFAMKRMYGQAWGKTIAKFALFSFAFFWCVVIALTGTAMAILMVL